MRPVLLSAPGAEDMTQRLAGLLQVTPGRIESRQFPDGESYLRIHEDLRGRDVAVVAMLRDPDAVALRLWFLADAARDLGARRVALVAPYLAYMRQDARFHDGEAVTAPTFARFVSSAFDWLATVDPHLHRIDALARIYTIPTEVVPSAPVIARWLPSHVKDPLIVGPDAESEQWVSEVARLAGCPWMALAKRRFGDRHVEVSAADASSHAGRQPVLLDDIVSSGRTMAEGVRRVREAFGVAPLCIGVHPVFAPDAMQALREAGAGRIVSCNTLPHESNAIDVMPAVADAVRRWAAQAR